MLSGCIPSDSLESRIPLSPCSTFANATSLTGLHFRCHADSGFQHFYYPFVLLLDLIVTDEPFCGCESGQSPLKKSWRRRVCHLLARSVLAFLGAPSPLALFVPCLRSPFDCTACADTLTACLGLSWGPIRLSGVVFLDLTFADCAVSTYCAGRSYRSSRRG